MEINKNILAEKAYDLYCEAVGGKAYNGDPLPKSLEFFSDPNKQKQADAWRKALEPIYELLLDVTRNLAHPAYGHSSSTKIGIDNLRNKAFDFLEIPEK